MTDYEHKKKNARAVCRVCCCLAVVNLALFFGKLYIGLTVNSFSVFADAVNNMFDSISVLVTFILLRLIMSSADKRTAGVLQKGEQLFSFLISIFIVITGLYFAYSSIERFFYPVPVVYTYLYVGILSGCALVKLTLFFFLRRTSKTLRSDVLRMLSVDSVLDFFVSCVTVLTLLLSGVGTFCYDAAFGFVISVTIIVSAGRMLYTSGSALINYVPLAKREQLEEMLDGEGLGEAVRHIKYLRIGDETEGFVYLTAERQLSEGALAAICEATGVRLRLIPPDADAPK